MNAVRRPWLPPPTIRGALFALLALAFLPLVLFGGWELSREYAQQRETEARASAELARSIASSVEFFVQGLVRTEYAVGAAILAHRSSPAEIQRELSLVVADLAPVRDMSFLDASGRVVASTEKELVGKSLYARDYFQEIRRGAEWRVSALLRSIVDGRPLFIVARGLRTGSGELLGIVAGAVDPEALGVLLRERAGSGSTSIRDANGTLVAIAPARALEWEDRRRGSDQRWVQRALAGQEGTGVFRSPLTSEQRIGAIVPISTLGWAALASRPLADAMAPVRHAALLHAAVLLVIALAALAASLYVAGRIAGPLRALEVEARRLARGGEPTKTVHGPVEVRRVASALRSMASGLSARHAELEALQGERETLMQTVSHDLRTPLHVIVAQAQIVRRLARDPDLERRAEAILATAGRMTRLIGDLVDAARLEAGRLELRPEPLDLGAFLLGWRDRMVGALAVERVRVEVGGTVPAVSADPMRLDQIVANLVSNALKYSLPGSEVRVALAREDGVLRLAVSDVGPGIAPDDVERIFERYYRARGAAHAEGLGLGLFITRKLVEAHGWRIEVASQVGKGSTFTVIIPVDGAGAAIPRVA